MASIFSLTDHEVFLLTCADNEGRKSGMIATWVLPASLLPDTPRLMFLSSPLNYTHELMLAKGSFVVHLLASDQFGMVPQFGLHSGRAQDKFDNIDMVCSNGGHPIVQGTCGWAECKVAANYDMGERVMVVGEVTSQKCFDNKKALTKRMAFSSLAPEVRNQLAEKHKSLGESSRKLYRKFL